MQGVDPVAFPLDEVLPPGVGVHVPNDASNRPPRIRTRGVLRGHRAADHDFVFLGGVAPPALLTVVRATDFARIHVPVDRVLGAPGGTAGLTIARPVHVHSLLQHLRFLDDIDLEEVPALLQNGVYCIHSGVTARYQLGCRRRRPPSARPSTSSPGKRGEDHIVDPVAHRI